MRNAGVRLLLILQVWLLLALTALTYASPADPPWIPGVYDAGDGDELVGLLADDGAVVGGVEHATETLLPARQRVPDPRSIVRGSPSATPSAFARLPLGNPFSHTSSDLVAADPADGTCQ